MLLRRGVAGGLVQTAREDEAAVEALKARRRGIDGSYRRDMAAHFDPDIMNKLEAGLVKAGMAIR